MARLPVFIFLVCLSAVLQVHNAEHVQKAEEFSEGGAAPFNSISDEDNSDLRQQFQQLHEEMQRSQFRFQQQLQEQEDRYKEQSDLTKELNYRLQKQDDQIQKQNEQIQKQSDQIQKQNTKIQEQSGEILDLKAKISWLTSTKGKIGSDDIGKEHDVTHRQHKHRQIRSDDTNAWEPALSHVTSQVTEINAEIEALKNTNKGTTYVRWGHSACPSSSQLVYSGEMGGSRYSQSGAAVNYLCLPPNPVFDNHPVQTYDPVNSHLQELYGAEYELAESNHDLNAVCAVCRTPRASSLMVPATNTCPPGWTLDYHGYLMAGSINHAAASEFICVDSSEKYQMGTNLNENGKLLYYTVTRCGSLPCPPYVNDKIVSCVVCSQ